MKVFQVLDLIYAGFVTGYFFLHKLLEVTFFMDFKINELKRNYST